MGVRDGFSLQAETTDGVPAEPLTLSSAIPNWQPGETIPLGGKTLRVVGLRDEDADQPPVLTEAARHARSAAG
jgi:hypothetical protein